MPDGSRTDEPDEYLNRAEAFGAFAAETIISDLRAELTLLSEGYRTLAGETRRRSAKPS